MADLSPAAQAVVNGAIELDYGQPTPVLYRRLAGALRAAADQVVPEYETTPRGSKIWPCEPMPSVRAELLAIAAELEGANG